jgi:hypothetical protein
MRWIWSEARQELVTPEELYAEKAAASKRSGLSMPNVISDCMEPTFCHADGKYYSSKRATERAVRAAGCEIVGNDRAFKKPKNPEYKSEGVATDIKRAIEEVNSR